MALIVTKIPEKMALRALQSGQAAQSAHYNELANGVNAFLGARFRLAAHAQVDYITSGSYDVLALTTAATHRVGFWLDPVSGYYWVGLGCTAISKRQVNGPERTRVDLTLEDSSGSTLDTATIYGTEMVTVPEGDRGLTFQPSSVTTPLGQEGISGYSHTGWNRTRYLEVGASDRAQAACLKLECYGVRVYSVDILAVQTGEL